MTTDALAELEVLINVKTGNLRADLDKIQSQLVKTGKKGTDAASAMSRAFSAAKVAAASFLGVLSSGAIVKFGAGAADAASKAGQQFGRLEGILRATGGAAGKTLQDIERLSRDLGESTLASTQGVRDAAAQLLTFRSVAGDVFDRTIRLAQDLAETGFGSISSASVQLGKALEDPVKGVSALARVGVSFSAAQIEVIKNLAETNRLAEAQGLILDAVAGQVGGAATSAAQGYAGALDTANERAILFSEALGEKLLPSLAAFQRARAEAFSFATDNIDAIVTTLQRVATTAATAAAVFAGRYVAGLVAAAASTATFSGALLVLRGALVRTGIGALIVGLGELVFQFTKVVESTGSIGAAFTALGGVASDIWRGISLAVSSAASAVEAASLGIIANITDFATAPAKLIADLINSVAIPAINTLATAIGSVLNPVLEALGRETVAVGQLLEIDLGGAATAAAVNLRSAAAAAAETSRSLTAGSADAFGKAGEALSALTAAVDENGKASVVAAVASTGLAEANNDVAEAATASAAAVSGQRDEQKRLIATLADEIKVLERRVAAQGRGTAAIREVEIAIQTETAALEANVAIGSEQFQQIESMIRARAKLQEQYARNAAALDREAQAAKDVIRERERASEEAIRTNERRIDSVVEFGAESFASLFEGTSRGWRGLMDSMLGALRQTFSRMAAEAVLRPIITPVLGAFVGGAAGLGAAGQASGGGFGGLPPIGGISGLLGGFSNLSLLGSGGSTLGNAFVGSGLGQSLGLSTGAASGIGPVAVSGLGARVATGINNLGNPLTGVAGFAGNFGANLLLGNRGIGADIGGGIGGLVGGAAFGPLGALGGAALGNVIGGLFQRKPSNKSQGSTVSADGIEQFGQSGKKFDQATRDAVDGIAAVLGGVLATVEREVGARLSGSIGFEVGSRDQSRIFRNGETVARAGVGDPQAALSAALDVAASALGNDIPAELARVIRSLDTSNPERALSDVSFAAALTSGKDLFPEPQQITAIEQAMDGLDAAMADARETANRLGLSFADVDRQGAAAADRIRAVFSDDIAQQILRITDPIKAELNDLEKVAAERIRIATRLGVDIVEVERLNALERQAIVDRGAAARLAIAEREAAARQAIAEREAEAAERAAAARLAAIQNEATAALGRLRASIDVASNAAQATLDAELFLIDARRKAAVERQAIEANALRAEIAARENAMSALRSLSSAVASGIEGLRLTIPAFARESRAAAQAALGATLDAARNGALPDAGAISETLRALTPNSGTFTTRADFIRDALTTQRQAQELQGIIDAQLTVDEMALVALKKRQADAERQNSALLASMDVERDAARARFESEIGRLDTIITASERDLEIASGTLEATLSVVAAVRELRDVMARTRAETAVATDSDFITGLYRDLLGRDPDETGATFFSKFLADGGSRADVASAVVNSQEFSNLRGFATGGDFRGGLRVVGERGPELEMTGPSRIISTEKLTQALGHDRATAAEIRGLRADMKTLMTNINRHTHDTAQRLRRWDSAGLPTERIEV